MFLKNNDLGILKIVLIPPFIPPFFCGFCTAFDRFFCGSANGFSREAEHKL